MVRRVIGCWLSLLALAGCQEAVHDRPEIAAGAAVMRLADPIPEGSVPHGASRQTGLNDDAAAANDAAPAVTPAVLERGKQVYELFCVSCHGPSGRGNGIVVQRGFPPPPSFHDEALRNLSRRHVYEVITHGQGAMASFAERIAPEDRWATAAYIEALQLAMSAPGEPIAQEPRR